jgi:Sec63 Brl domain
MNIKNNNPDANNKKKNKNTKSNDDKMKEAILALVCQSSEFSRVSSKQNERKMLNDLNLLTEFPLKKSAADGERKVRVLL